MKLLLGALAPLTAVVLSVQGAAVNVRDFGAKGDGEADDAAAIQAALDRPDEVLEVTIPAGSYRIGRTLRMRSHTHLLVETGARLFVCGRKPHVRGDFLLTNAHHEGAPDEDISIRGGMWDGNSRDGHNVKPDDLFCEDGWSGATLNFRNVKGLRLERMTLANSVTYNVRMCQVDGFDIRDISFFADRLGWNQDGLHFNGCCYNGTVENVRAVSDGQTNDDLLAFNADDSLERIENYDMVRGAITNIHCRNISAANCHTPVRLLSVDAPIRDVTIENLAAGCREYFVNLDGARYCRTPLFDEEERSRGVGAIENVVLRNCRFWVSENRQPDEPLVPFETNARSISFENLWRDKSIDKGLQRPFMRVRNCADLKVQMPKKVVTVMEHGEWVLTEAPREGVRIAGTVVEPPKVESSEESPKVEPSEEPPKAEPSEEPPKAEPSEEPPKEVEEKSVKKDEKKSAAQPEPEAQPEPVTQPEPEVQPEPEAKAKPEELQKPAAETKKVEPPKEEKAEPPPQVAVHPDEKEEPKDPWCVELPKRGCVTLMTEPDETWTHQIRRIDDGRTAGVYEIEYSVSGDKDALPPPVRIEYVMEQRDVQYRWAPEGSNLPVPWQDRMGEVETSAKGQVPVQAWLAQSDLNRLTFACSDASSSVVLSSYEQEFGGSKLRAVAKFFARGGVPRKDYKTVLRFDFREVPYWETVAEAADWIAAFPGNESPAVPEVAYEPLWNTWYGYHTGYTAEDVEREGMIASQLGIRTILYDMGWDREGTTNTSDFAQCGDWIPSAKDFPDVKAHIDKMHAMGLKCIFWCGFPLMGTKANNLPASRKLLLTPTPEAARVCYVLDPRFPVVRTFVSDTLAKGVSEWGVDGWKIDFVQTLRDRGDDRVPKEGMNGRDLRWVADAARVLQEEFSGRLRALNPDVMFEFMYPYGGILGQRACTQVRAADCPADLVWNRNQTVRLRLLCGNRAAVHSDMLTWSPEESPEACAQQIISVLHSVVQYGMRLTALTDDQRRVIAHWAGFARCHRDTLLKGAFRPHGVAGGYPLVEMESAAERIFTVHQPHLCVRVHPDKPALVVNGSGCEGAVLDLRGSVRATFFDTYGVEVGSRSLEAGIVRLPVPRSGYVWLLPR